MVYVDILCARSPFKVDHPFETSNHQELLYKTFFKENLDRRDNYLSIEYNIQFSNM